MHLLTFPSRAGGRFQFNPMNYLSRTINYPFSGKTNPLVPVLLRATTGLALNRTSASRLALAGVG